MLTFFSHPCENVYTHTHIFMKYAHILYASTTCVASFFSHLFLPVHLLVVARTLTSTFHGILFDKFFKKRKTHFYFRTTVGIKVSDVTQRSLNRSGGLLRAHWILITTKEAEEKKKRFHCSKCNLKFKGLLLLLFNGFSLLMCSFVIFMRL